MDDPKRLRRDVAWNLVPVALLAVVGLGLNIVIGWWGPDALGAFNLVTPAFFAFAVLGAGGLQYSVLRSIAEHIEDDARVATVVVGALVPAVGLAAVAAVLCFALAGPVGALVSNDDVTTGLHWVTPGVFCFALNKVLMGVVNGLRRMRAYAVYTSLRYVLIAVGLAVAWSLQAPADHLAVIWTFAEGLLLLVLIGELLASVRLRRAVRWWPWMRTHLDFGLRGLPATLAFEVNSKLDVWLLGVALPESVVGVYALASSLFEGASQLAIVVQSNLNPLIARDLTAGRPEAVEAMVKRTRRWFVPLMVAACAASIVAYPYVVPWLTGDARFAAGASSFTVLMISLAVTSPWLPFNQLLLMAGAPGWHTLYIVLWFVFMFVANYVLIPIYGILGAAIGTAVTLAFSVGLLVGLARWRAKVRL